ncbi:DUF2269 domain-containing protein [Maricaulis sp.]|uniref:DUF2269 family protein n=1 Tax=Maricaulis sp. TaxID=1486257 RepID=UPI001AFE50BE|nr:DUF2269 domain-containing protein [Maricaulis sp.]MBO6765625.1 DUF2269 domain-containing protein [Maricaulis sp.]
MDLYVIARLVHILSACVLFGSGAAIAFFMLMAWRSGERAGFALASRHVVLADWLFTASAVVIQPLSGIALAHLAGWPLTAPWLLASYGLYGFIGACWLPVVWIQYRVRDRLAAAEGEAVPPEVHRLMRIWFVLGWPAFAALIAIFVLMITKPGV